MRKQVKQYGRRGRKDIRVLPEISLYKQIAAEAKKRRTSMGGYLLLAAEEKLARDAKGTETKAA